MRVVRAEGEPRVLGRGPRGTSGPVGHSQWHVQPSWGTQCSPLSWNSYNKYLLSSFLSSTSLCWDIGLRILLSVFVWALRRKTLPPFLQNVKSILLRVEIGRGGEIGFVSVKIGRRMVSQPVQLPNHRDEPSP